MSGRLILGYGDLISFEYEGVNKKGVVISFSVIEMRDRSIETIITIYTGKLNRIFEASNDNIRFSSFRQEQEFGIQRFSINDLIEMNLKIVRKGNSVDEMSLFMDDVDNDGNRC